MVGRMGIEPTCDQITLSSAYKAQEISPGLLPIDFLITVTIYNERSTMKTAREYQESYGTSYYNDKNQKKNKRIKKLAKELFGNRCQICRYDRCLRSLHFHHINEKEKIFPISKMFISKLHRRPSIREFVLELNKCVLICGNCHGEIHDNLINIDHISRIFVSETDFYKNNIRYSSKGTRLHRNEYETDTGDILQNTCKVCNTILSKRQQIVCSKKCSDIYRTGKPSKLKDIPCPQQDKIKWPSKEELTKLVWEMTSKELAIKLGISDTAIVKKCKKFGIEKPPRGYWQKLAASTTKP